ncbi:MAG: VWA domain-containing protein [Clostridia bacterium]|nr:VWA domain-containing protein [Clostridia bacterium]
MRKNLTEMVFILDKSGSMAGMEKDTVGGFNAMIEKQKREEGDALVSTVLFSDGSRVIHDRADITKVEPLTDRQYFVGGCTALYDAVGDAIHHIGNVHKYAREEDRPEKTVFVITTDGMENASRRYSASEVRRLITRQKEKYGWEFLFLGANIDARSVADDMGIEEERSACFVNDSRGNALKYEGISRAMSKVRKCMPMGAEWKADMEEDCRKREYRP